MEEEEVTSGPGKKTLEHRPHDTESEPTWSRVRDSDYRGVALLLKGVLRLSGGLRADHHSGPVPVCVNCIRLLVDCHELQKIIEDEITWSVTITVSGGV